MNYRSLLSLALGWTLVLLASAGCVSTATPIPDPSATKTAVKRTVATHTPQPAAPDATSVPVATPSLDPTIVRTAPPAGSPVPAISTPAALPAGPRLSGPIEIKQGASGGTIELTLTEDGKSIAKVGLTLNDIKAEKRDGAALRRVSMEKWSLQKEGPTHIATLNSDGSFVIPLGNQGEINGQLSSPKKASGSVHVVIVVQSAPSGGVGSSTSYDLGTWDWTAQAD